MGKTRTSITDFHKYAAVTLQSDHFFRAEGVDSCAHCKVFTFLAQQGHARVLVRFREPPLTSVNLFSLSSFILSIQLPYPLGHW